MPPMYPWRDDLLRDAFTRRRVADSSSRVTVHSDWRSNRNLEWRFSGAADLHGSIRFESSSGGVDVEPGPRHEVSAEER